MDMSNDLLLSLPSPEISWVSEVNKSPNSPTHQISTWTIEFWYIYQWFFYCFCEWNFHHFLSVVFWELKSEMFLSFLSVIFSRQWNLDHFISGFLIVLWVKLIWLFIAVVFDCFTSEIVLIIFINGFLIVVCVKLFSS